MKKTIFKRIFCVFFAVFILAVLVIPAAADSYYSEVPDDTFPSNLVFAMNAYNNNLNKYRIGFKSGEEMPGYFEYPLPSYQSNFIHSRREAWDNSLGYDISYIENMNTNYDIYLHFTVYVCLTYGVNDDEYIVSFSGDDISNAVVFETSYNRVFFNIDTSNLVFSSPDIAISGVPYDLISGVHFEILGQRDYSDDSIVNWYWGTQSTSGSEIMYSLIPYWFVVVEDTSVDSVSDFVSTGHFVSTFGYIASYYFAPGSYVQVSGSSSGSGTTDPGNNSGSGSGTSDPGESGSGTVTPVDDPEEFFASDGTLVNFVFAIFQAPMVLLSSMLDFTIFGINLYGVLKVLLTLSLSALLIAAIVKLILHFKS